MEKSNLKELNNQSLDELLEKHSFEQLVERYSLEHLERRFGIDKILSQFNEIKEDPGGEIGVLSSREIKRYVNNFRLICPFDEKNNLKGASYYLSLGDEYAVGGKKKRLSDESTNNHLTIPAFEVAIIKTKEIINMPRFLIGRWNIRVTQGYKGLLWVGGPQVDPGWVGHLFCPVYNLSSEEVTLRKGEKLATIDFVRTTTFEKDKEKEYIKFNRDEAKKTISDYNWQLRSGLFTLGIQRINDLDKRVTRFETLIGVCFALTAILFAGLAILITSAEKVIQVSQPIWVYVSMVLAIAAITISLFVRIKLEKLRWFKILIIIYLIALTVFVILLGVKMW